MTLAFHGIVASFIGWEQEKGAKRGGEGGKGGKGRGGGDEARTGRSTEAQNNPAQSPMHIKTTLLCHSAMS